MIVNYYCVEDCKAKQFGPLFPAKNTDVAKRMFKSLLHDVDPEYYPDYFLHLVGKFDDALGVFGSVGVSDDPFICGAVFLEDKK